MNQRHLVATLALTCYTTLLPQMQAAELPETLSIPIIIHDIHDSHPNFQIRGFGHVRGIVQDELGADGKPLWSPTAPSSRYGNLTNENDFNQWWTDTPGLSMTVPANAIIGGIAKNSALTLTKNVDDTYSFVSNAFFPLAEGNVAEGATLTPYRQQNFQSAYRQILPPQPHTNGNPFRQERLSSSPFNSITGDYPQSTLHGNSFCP